MPANLIKSLIYLVYKIYDKDNVEDEIIPEEDDTPKDPIDNPPVEGDTNLEEYDNVEKVDVPKEEE